MVVHYPRTVWKNSYAENELKHYELMWGYIFDDLYSMVPTVKCLSSLYENVSLKYDVVLVILRL